MVKNPKQGQTLPPRKTTAQARTSRNGPASGAKGNQDTPNDRSDVQRAGAPISNRSMQQTLWLTGIADAALLGIGLGLAYIPAIGITPLAGALALIAILNFFSFFWFFKELQDAIASAVILNFIILLAAMFNTKVQDALNHTSLGQSMLTTLTATVTTIAAFYFAGRTFQKVTETKAKSN